MSDSTRYMVLGMVRRRPSYGYRLVEELRQWPGPPGVAPGPRAVYKALQALSEEQWIEPLEATTDRAPDGPSRRRFAATEEGARRYEDWLRSPPESFIELFRRIASARRDDLPALLALVINAEHVLLADHRELRAPEVESLLATRAPWEAISGALMAAAHTNEVASRATFLRDLRRVLEEVLEHTSAPDWRTL
jgi:DNA-binding PadR family transcriptional regulator